MINLHRINPPLASEAITQPDGTTVEIFTNAVVLLVQEVAVLQRGKGTQHKVFVDIPDDIEARCDIKGEFVGCTNHVLHFFLCCLQILLKYSFLFITQLVVLLTIHKRGAIRTMPKDVEGRQYRAMNKKLARIGGEVVAIPTTDGKFPSLVTLVLANNELIGKLGIILIEVDEDYGRTCALFLDARS